MKKRLICIVLTLMTSIACFSAMSIGASAIRSDDVVITIDPGHGGDDPGNTQASTLYGNNKTEHYESRHVYDISLYIKERLLQYTGVTVYLTRGDLDSTEPCPSLNSRPDLAKQYDSDAFVSIHTNAFDTTVSGAEIHVPSKKISYNNDVAVASHEAAQIVLNTMGEQTGIKISRGLKYNQITTSTYSTGEGADKLAVIRQGRKNNIPVVMLIETGFADNEGDFTNHFSTTEKRKQMGYAIADGLAKYYDLAFFATYGDMLSSIILPDGWAWADPDVTVGNAGVNTFTAIHTAEDSSTVTKELTVKVEKASPDYTIPKNISAQFKSMLSEVTLPDGWAWQDGSVELSSLGVCAFPAIFTPEDTDNFISIKTNISVNVSCTDHIFENACDTTCECGFVRVTTHTYSNNCDAECNICSFTRVPEDHVYSYPCDAVCNVCSAVRAAEDHTYENSCDASCNVCDEAREITHTYDNDCDTHCNICDAERKITHTYSHQCDKYCNVCSEKRDVDNHTYSNGCDAYCDICSFKRVPEDHVYTDSCDTSCNICSAERDAIHTYDNDCDGVCNVCNATRDVAHVYDNDTCDMFCNICNEKRSVSHVYDSENDSECNACGAVRAVVSANAQTGRSCASSVSGILAVITSIAIGFAFTRKKK